VVRLCGAVCAPRLGRGGVANQPAHRSHRGDGTAVRGYRQQPLRDAGAVVSTNRPLRLTIIVRGRTLAFCRRAVRSRFSVRHMRRRTGGAFRASSPVTSFRLSPAKRYRRTHRTAGYFCLGSIARSTAAVIHRRAPYPLNGDGVSTYRHCRQSRSSTGLKFPQNRGHSPLRGFSGGYFKPLVQGSFGEYKGKNGRPSITSTKNCFC